MLIDSLRANPDAMAHIGVGEDELKALDNELEALRKADDELEVLREQVSAGVRNANRLLADVRERYIATKKLVKENYPQDDWMRYGVPDKR